MGGKHVCVGFNHSRVTSFSQGRRQPNVNQHRMGGIGITHGNQRLGQPDSTFACFGHATCKPRDRRGRQCLGWQNLFALGKHAVHARPIGLARRER